MTTGSDVDVSVSLKARPCFRGTSRARKYWELMTRICVDTTNRPLVPSTAKPVLRPRSNGTFEAVAAATTPGDDDSCLRVSCSNSHICEVVLYRSEVKEACAVVT